MFVNVHNESFCIVNASACTISKLDWIHQGISCTNDVLFYIPLQSFVHQGGSQDEDC